MKVIFSERKKILWSRLHSHLLPPFPHTPSPLCGRTPADPVYNQYDPQSDGNHHLHRALVDDPGEHALVDVVQVKVEGGSAANDLRLASWI